MCTVQLEIDEEDCGIIVRDPKYVIFPLTRSHAQQHMWDVVFAILFHVLWMAKDTYAELGMAVQHY